MILMIGNREKYMNCWERRRCDWYAFHKCKRDHIFAIPIRSSISGAGSFNRGSIAPTLKELLHHSFLRHRINHAQPPRDRKGDKNKKNFPVTKPFYFFNADKVVSQSSIISMKIFYWKCDMGLVPFDSGRFEDAKRVSKTGCALCAHCSVPVA